MVFDEVLNETSADLQEAFSGWKRIWNDLVESFQFFDEFDGKHELPKENHQSLGGVDIISSFLLLFASPIALLRNIMVLVMEAPFSNTAWLLLIFLLIPALLLTQPELWQTSAAISTSSSSSQANDAALWNAASLLLMILCQKWRKTCARCKGGWLNFQLRSTLQGTNISPKNGILKMIFLFPRWDMLISWRVVLMNVDTVI